MKRRTYAMLLMASLTVAGVGLNAHVNADAPPQAMGRIYVRSQDKFFATFAPTSLPPLGNFQLLEMGPHGPETEYGPGDVGYLGGRWMADFDGDGEFNYFLCPLFKIDEE